MSDASIAVSTTGVGELLAKVNWASTCGILLQSDAFNTPVAAISSAIKEKFLGKESFVPATAVISYYSNSVCFHRVRCVFPRIGFIARSKGTERCRNDWISLGWSPGRIRLGSFLSVSSGGLGWEWIQASQGQSMEEDIKVNSNLKFLLFIPVSR